MVSSYKKMEGMKGMFYMGIKAKFVNTKLNLQEINYLRRDLSRLRYNILALLFIPEVEAALKSLPFIQHKDAKAIYQQQMLLFFKTIQFKR